MNKPILFCISAILLLAAGCTSSREKLTTRIGSLETRLFGPSAETFDKVKADSLLGLYMEFIDEFPKDSLSPAYLFKAANVAMNGGDGGRALELFQRYLGDYPEGPKASLSLFFTAFVYENVVHNLDKARETYLLFIEKYPADDFTDDAQLALANLGKSPEDMIREFEARQKADSARQADSLAALEKKGKGR